MNNSFETDKKVEEVIEARKEEDKIDEKALGNKESIKECSGATQTESVVVDEKVPVVQVQADKENNGARGSETIVDDAKDRMMELRRRKLEKERQTMSKMM